LSAWECVESAKIHLRTITFEEVITIAERFVEKSKERFESTEEYSDLKRCSLAIPASSKRPFFLTQGASTKLDIIFFSESLNIERLYA